MEQEIYNLYRKLNIAAKNNLYIQESPDDMNNIYLDFEAYQEIDKMIKSLLCDFEKFNDRINNKKLMIEYFIKELSEDMYLSQESRERLGILSND